MITNDLCSKTESMSRRRMYFHQRKLEMLKFYKDSLERRIASVKASIEVLENQIERDNNQHGN